MSAPPVQIFRILDHCGCSVRATYQDKAVNGLDYYVACEACKASLPKHKYQFYMLSCSQDVLQYPLKDLLSHKGWTDQKTWLSVMSRRGHPCVEFFDNARHLNERMAKSASISLKS